MEQLFLGDYINHYGLFAYSGSVDDVYLRCDESYFEIKDDSSKTLTISKNKNFGEAKIANPNKYMVGIFNYDKFVSALDAKFQDDKKRCDMILATDNDFILAELKDSQNKKAESRARKQLLQSLETIIDVPAIDTYITQHSTRKCCYFNRQASTSNSEIINTTITAFNRPSNISPNGLKMKNKKIEDLGFEFWQYTGNQVLTLA